MSVKIEIERKTRQNAENKQTFDLTGKIEIEGKTRQNAENKQTFDLTRKNTALINKMKDFSTPIYSHERFESHLD